MAKRKQKSRPSEQLFPDSQWDLFEKSYKLYSLFWGLNLGAVDVKDVKQKKKNEVDFILTGDQKVASEAKHSSDRQLRKPSGLRAFGKIYPDFKHVVATMSQFAFNEGVYYLPGWMI